MNANRTAARINELRTVLDRGIREGLGVGASLGINVESLEEGLAVYVLDANPATINAMFTVHGGVLATLMDTAMGSAVFTTLEDGVGYTTLELKVNFTRAVALDLNRVAAGFVADPQIDRLTCEARTVHVGRRTATAEARVTDPKGRLIAHGSCTCMILR
jgi:uncharacterized protein (TIGR00369 family)